MIIIYITLVIMFVILAFMTFNNVIKFGQHPTTFLLLSWFFGLLTLNIFISLTIYGYYYYKKNINPFIGIQGPSGYSGPSGNVGASTTLCNT